MAGVGKLSPSHFETVHNRLDVSLVSEKVRKQLLSMKSGKILFIKSAIANVLRNIENVSSPLYRDRKVDFLHYLKKITPLYM